MNINMNKNIEKKITLIENKVNIIENKVNSIFELINTDLKNNCNKMGEHINFIEHVYDQVKNPLGYICNRINTCKIEDRACSIEDEKKYTEIDTNITDISIIPINPKNIIGWWCIGGIITGGIVIKYCYK